MLNGKKIKLVPFDKKYIPHFVEWNKEIKYFSLQTTEPFFPKSDEDRYEQIEEWAKDSDNIVFIINTMEEPKTIGFIALSEIEWNNKVVELTIGIGNPDFWGKGYGRDSLITAINYIFKELNFHRISLTVLSYNQRAKSLYESLGFVKEGSYREYGQRNGKRYNLDIYGMLCHEWH